MEEKDIPDLNIFMMCEKVNTSAFSDLNKNYYIRNCREDELDIWKEFHFNNKEDKKKYYQYMTNYLKNVYEDKEKEFFSKCLFICEKSTNKPVSTCFIWKAYDKIHTIHWFKTLKNHEGKGLGRALLTYLLKDLQQKDLPIYLHTQPSSFRAIGLYSDFGFKIVTNQSIGYRNNDYKEALPILKQFMRKDTFDNLKFTKAPTLFDEVAKSSKEPQF